MGKQTPNSPQKIKDPPTQLTTHPPIPTEPILLPPVASPSALPSSSSSSSVYKRARATHWEARTKKREEHSGPGSDQSMGSFDLPFALFPHPLFHPRATTMKRVCTLEIKSSS